MAQDLQDWLNAGGFLLTLVLTLLSASAYAATRERKLLFVGFAFLLWTIRMGINAAASFIVPEWEGANWVELEGSILDTLTPAILFFAIVRRERPIDAD